MRITLVLQLLLSLSRIQMATLLGTCLAGLLIVGDGALASLDYLGESVVLGMVLMSPRDVGRLLNLSTSRIVQLEREGRLKAERDSSGRRFFLREIVEQFAAERAAQRAAASKTARGHFAAKASPHMLIVSRTTTEVVSRPPSSGAADTAIED